MHAAICVCVLLCPCLDTHQWLDLCPVNIVTQIDACYRGKWVGPEEREKPKKAEAWRGGNCKAGSAGLIMPLLKLGRTLHTLTHTCRPVLRPAFDRACRLLPRKDLTCSHDYVDMGHS